MRLFFALTFDAATKRELDYYRQLISDNAEKGRYTSEANLHLTLEFIGKSCIQQYGEMTEILHQLSDPPLAVTAERFGSFERRGEELVWLGIRPEPKLMALQNQLADLLREVDFEAESRPYLPHITLGRNIVMPEPAAELAFQPIELNVHSVALMESVSIDGKLIYRTMDEVFVRPDSVL